MNDLLATGVPDAEVEVDVSLVRRLLQAQHPDLAHLPVRPADSGWDNVMFRLGDDLAVRLPRRAAAVPYHERERRWLPLLAPRLPLPVPAAVRTGSPGHGYPWTWSIVPWLSGVAADQASATPAQIPTWSRFLAALHVPAPADAPQNLYRSVPLRELDEYLQKRWRRLEAHTDLITPVMRSAWSDGLRAGIDVEPTWIHGDLHALNVLVQDGAISGVIDWGDMAQGDRAVDLASIWMLFESAGDREGALMACEVSAATRARARAWAVYFATVFAHSGLGADPRHARLGARILARVGDGP